MLDSALLGLCADPGWLSVLMSDWVPFRPCAYCSILVWHEYMAFSVV